MLMSLVFRNVFKSLMKGIVVVNWSIASYFMNNPSMVCAALMLRLTNVSNLSGKFKLYIGNRELDF